MFPGGAFDRYRFKLSQRLKTSGKLSEDQTSIRIQHTRPDAEQLGWR